MRVSKQGEKLRLHRFFDRVSDFFQPNSVVIAETGVSMFALAETLLPGGSVFIGQIFYGSIGYTVGAALGVGIALQDTVPAPAASTQALTKADPNLPGQGGRVVCR